MQYFCSTPTKMRRYWVDGGVWRALKTQLLSTRQYPPGWPCSGSSPVVPASSFFPHPVSGTLLAGTEFLPLEGRGRAEPVCRSRGMCSPWIRKP